jgi:hypothetical protein
MESELREKRNSPESPRDAVQCAYSTRYRRANAWARLTAALRRPVTAL